MNKKIIEGLEAIATGLLTIVAGLKESEVTAETVSTAEVIVPTVADDERTETEQDITPVETSDTPLAEEESFDEFDGEDATEVEASVDETNSDNDRGYTEEQLGDMTYNNLKKLAKELGLSAVGTRKELVKKILSVNTTVKEEPSSDDSPVEAEVVKNDVPVKRGLIKKQPEPVEEEPEEDESDEEEEIDPVEARILKETEDMTDDEIRGLLAEVEMSTKGKRQALISRLVDAVNEGLIELEDEEEIEEEVTTEEEPDEPEDVDEDKDLTENMTKRRRETFEEICDDTTEQFESGEITRDDLTEFLTAFDGEEYSPKSLKKITDEDLLTEYFKAVSLMIDDTGNVVEEGAYTINDEPYCCGHPLTYNSKKNRFICDHCGEEYEAE